MTRSHNTACGLLALLVLAACAGPSAESGDTAVAGRVDSASEAQATDEPQGSEPTELSTLSSFPPDDPLIQEWTGDLDGMVERRYIRALVIYSKTNYFLDRATQRGVSYEALKEFEKVLNQQLGRKTLQVEVVIIPVGRDELVPALVRGVGDLAVANLTITPQRQELVDFSQPLATGIRELVVTGPIGPELGTLDDLSGKPIHVRRSSSYWSSLEALNADFSGRGLDPVELVPAKEFLEDEDLLEMVNAGLIPTVVVDSHKMKLWAQIFENLVVHDNLAVRDGGQIGWAFRKQSPQLKEAVDSFVRGHKKGTLFGNILLKRYFENTRWVRNALAEKDMQRFRDTLALFEKYAEQYDFDYLMLIALAYQESRLDQSVRSAAGAVGVMQLLPSTAADPNVGIPKIDELENNIHAGAKYLRFLRDRYFSDETIGDFDQVLFTYAAYNAGPARVRSLRNEAEDMGLDPNKWFRNVEVVAARRIGRETVRYVSNISKYYVVYTQVVAQLKRKGALD